ncbi:hypothetical protein [Conexibacter woesei]|uniref:Tail sheath protein subtilisin-like domain-containing protein n=1 Tax=Conexibacter woesei (strain DSM 14684 / CCUG 47730 / CIP 108061 / JCM 11494 / NBRC 100937 / ID131577) TaxID=469383 RepID=D3F1Z0_CONWI|nr:hypothetical protein [Conexibacter woesei]ADB50165.1 hypothetical protein Cwoe_1738 [Conexibacter woesei DSM 14684]
MPLPEVIVRRGDRGAAELPADDVSTRFEAVVCERGPVEVPIEVRSVSQLRTRVGDHTGYSTLRAVESYFAEGGARAVLSRVVGPAHRTATLELRDDRAATVLTVRAEGPGSWYHGVRVTAASDTTSARMVTVDLDGAELVRGVCASALEAQDLINRSGYATATIGVGTWPPVASSTPQPLAGGDDDYAGIRDRQAVAALTAFDESLGAGSVCASGWTTVLMHTALADHAAATNRLARADMPDIADVATLATDAAAIRRLPNARYIQLLAGYPQITTAGVTIPVPPSGVHTGREAQADRENGAGPGQPCAWTFGEYATPVSVRTAWSRAQREQLLDAGITVIVQDARGEVYAEDAITAVDPIRYPQYAEVSAMRVTMAIHAQAKAVLRRHVKRTIDGRGHLAAVATGDLVAICADWYSRDALYGESSGDAFHASVVADTSPEVRPRLVGYLALRPSPSAHTIELTITQVAAGDTI